MQIAQLDCFVQTIAIAVELTFRRTSAIKNQMTSFLRNNVLKKLGT